MPIQRRKQPNIAVNFAKSSLAVGSPENHLKYYPNPSKVVGNHVCEIEVQLGEGDREGQEDFRPYDMLDYVSDVDK